MSNIIIANQDLYCTDYHWHFSTISKDISYLLSGCENVTCQNKYHLMGNMPDDISCTILKLR